MGNNHCKDLGIQPGTPIGTAAFDAIWSRYGGKKSVSTEGTLSAKSAKKLLQDLASAAQIPFNDEIANRIIKENSNSSNVIQYEAFKTLFRSLTTEEPRFQLTQSLQTKIGDDDVAITTSITPTPTIPTPTIPTPTTQKSKSQTSDRIHKVPPPSEPRTLPNGWARKSESKKPKTVVTSTLKEIYFTSPMERFFELTFGEDTNLHIDVLEAHFFFNVIPFLNACVVDAEFIVTNSRVAKDIQAKLRLPLNTGAVVSRFAFEALPGTMVDGIVLPKKKAAAVEYLEKEKGRNVGTTKKVEGDLFETTVFPLPHNQRRRSLSLSLSSSLLLFLVFSSHSFFSSQNGNQLPFST
jgi:hypothetical protein